MKKMRNSILAFIFAAVGGAVLNWCVQNQTLFTEIALREKVGTFQHFLLHLVNLPIAIVAFLMIICGANGLVYWTTGKNIYKTIYKKISLMK